MQAMTIEQRMRRSRFWHDWFELSARTAEALDQENFSLGRGYTIRFRACCALQAAATEHIPLGVLLQDQQTGRSVEGM